jgi:hypothetical protein
MMERSITIDGAAWMASISGKTTVYDRDEFSLVFERRDEHGKRVRRISRFSPTGARNRSQALEELKDAELLTLFAQSQPEWTSPELGYAQS